jgi:hypothetical protein
MKSAVIGAIGKLGRLVIDKQMDFDSKARNV